jgi:GNAT superfamily N-acetyltransferase
VKSPVRRYPAAVSYQPWLSSAMRNTCSVDGDHLIARLEQVDAQNAVAFALALSAHDPTWGTETLAVAGGHLVLSGKGLYVNRALATGIDNPLRAEDLGLIVHRSETVGVPPSVEVTPATHADSVAQLVEHGFVHDASADVTALVRQLDDLPDELGRDGIEIRSVGERSLAEWQEVSALGWGHDTEARRRAADAFAVAAYAVDGDGMVIAVDASDGRPLGCASLTLRDEVATLGGMSTIPAERGRGVQAALILHRLRIAREAGCTIATSTTVVGGASERNVQRFGFRPMYVKQTWVRR